MNSKLTEKDMLKSIAYTAISQQRMTEKGFNTYEKSKEIVDRWVKSFDVEIKDYFKKENHNVDGHYNVGKELAKDAWEAFEYFELL